jgi:hypothetical protein
MIENKFQKINILSNAINSQNSSILHQRASVKNCDYVNNKKTVNLIIQGNCLKCTAYNGSYFYFKEEITFNSVDIGSYSYFIEYPIEVDTSLINNFSVSSGDKIIIWAETPSPNSFSSTFSYRLIVNLICN